MKTLFSHPRRYLVVLTVLCVTTLACALLGSPQVTPEPSAPPKVVASSTAAVSAPTKVAASPTTRPTQTPAATSTPMLGANVPLVDNGQPLAPQVIASKPDRGQEAAVNGVIELTFDQPMDTSATGAALQVLDETDQPVDGKVTWLTDSTLQFKPARPLEAGKTYLARLDTSASSAAGAKLADRVTLEFTAVGELQVSQVFPADQSTDIAADSTITVIFNRPVIPLVIAEEQANLPQPLKFDPPIAGRGEWINTSVYAYHPKPALLGGATYKVTVAAGLADALGESALGQDTSWSFTTRFPGFSYYSLFNQVSGSFYNPENYFSNVVPDAYFSINFEQPMHRASTEAAISLADQNGQSSALVFDWKLDDTQVIITPTASLALANNYTLNLSASAQAANGGGLREGLNWAFTTLPYPDFSTSPVDGSKQSYYESAFTIYFVSPMKLASLKDKVVFSPAPVNEPEWTYQDWNWSLNFYGILQPSTTYQVTIKPGMEDLYGNVITEQRVIRFTTAKADPYASLVMPYNTALYRVGAAQDFYVSYRNVSGVTFWLYRLAPDQFFNMDWPYQPPESGLVWTKKLPGSSSANQRAFEKMSLVGDDEKPLPPGFYFLGMDAAGLKHDGKFADTRTLVVANASLNFKTTQTEGLVWLTDLTSGAPVANVPVTVYDKDYQPIANGVTGADGLLYLALPKPAEVWNGRYAVAQGGEYFAYAFSETGSGVNPWDFGIWDNYYAEPTFATSYIYTDRPIYRPDQPVYFKGIVRSDDDLHYSLPSDSEAQVTIRSYADEVVYDEKLPLNVYGTFSGQFTLDKEATLGYYSVQVTLPGGANPVGYGSFTVAEYRKPEFLVDVSAEPQALLGGNNFNAAVQADFYSGGGVGGADVYWTLTADSYFFKPSDDYSNFSFSDINWDTGYYWQGPNSSGEMVAQGSGVTDANGNFTVSVPASLSEAGGSRQLTFEATIADRNGNAVSGRASVVAHQSQVYAGIRTLSYVGAAGKPLTLEVVALDWDSNPAAGQSVDVEIVERRWHSIQKQDAQGRITWDSTVEEIPVITIPGVTLDDKGLAQVTFTPPNGGSFKARAIVHDSLGNQARGSTYLWVSSGDYIPWRVSNDRGFQLVSDRKSYTPGDSAEILIASPFQGQPYALVTVERGHVRRYEVIRLESNSQVYRLPITADMAPSVYVSVLIIKGVDDTSTKPDFRMGMVELSVDTTQQQLKVELVPDKTQAGPGDTVNYQVRTTDLAGNPVAAEVSLSLSDLATLSLADPTAPPLLDFFYSRRGLSVKTAVPIVDSIEDYNALIQEYAAAQGEGMGSGGGKGSDEWGVIAVRQNFPDTAYWEAHLVTDGSGQATVSVTLPDNLTTWRMDARAVTQDTRVGQTTLDIVSTKPLLVRPKTPRFFVVGDTVTLGAAIHNNTNDALSVEASLQATGLILNGDAAQTIEIPAHQQAYVTWDVTVSLDTDRVDLIFLAKSGAYSDATRPTLGTLDNQGIPVYKYQAPETVGTSGMVPEGSTILEAISLPQAFPVSSGTLTIQASPSLAAGLTDGLNYLEHYPYECVEQTISKFLPNVVTLHTLQAAGVSDPALQSKLEEQVSTALQRLYNWQNPDGGWGWWGRQESSLMTSAYATFALAELRDAGYSVDDKVFTEALRYLKNQLRSFKNVSGAEPYLLNRQAFVLYVLTRAGDPAEFAKLVELYDLRDNLALYARAYLARSIAWADSGDPRIQTLLSDFNNAAIASATGTHWEETYRDWWNWNTDTRTTAIVLSTLAELDSKNPLNANAVRWLMSNRTDGHWQGTQETTWTILALSNWMTASGELNANYEFAIGLNGERIGGGVANQDTLRETTELTVSVADLLKDQANRLAIARSEGAGNLYYTAHLTVDLPVEQITALDRGIIVSRSYYRVEDRETPVTDAAVGDLLLVKLTVVAPHSLHYVVVDDPLPAGLEAVDQSLKTSEQAVQPDQTNYNWEDFAYYGWGWWIFDHIELRDERVVLSANYLPAGTYTYSYLARASTPGAFKVIPPTAQEFYFPEVYGRGDGMLFTVKP